MTSSICATLLVVDDEFPTLDTLAEVLRWDGHTVHTAADGRQALEVLASTSVDLVLLDVMMPILDGLETLRELRARPELAALPVILMTAAPNGVPHDAPPHDALLVKPFTAATLRTVLAHSLALRRSTP
ncbi:MAG: response regulator [Labilithrix sp.]|nr:response regulator [Labilithrix sp.]MCW5818219.1 response regulator [Labilithrix sp.]